MKEGFYSITFMGTAGNVGVGVLVLDTGFIVGVDIGGVRYDGEYKYNPKTEMLDADVTLTVPPGVPLVTGIPPQNKEWSFTFQVSFPRETPQTPILVQTPTGPVNVVIRFLRGFP